MEKRNCLCHDDWAISESKHDPLTYCAMLGSHSAMPRCCSQLTTQRELLKVLKRLCCQRRSLASSQVLNLCSIL